MRKKEREPALKDAEEKAAASAKEAAASTRKVAPADRAAAAEAAEKTAAKETKKSVKAAEKSAAKESAKAAKAAAAEETVQEGKKGKSRRAAKSKKKGKHKRLKVMIAVCVALALCGTGLGVGLLFIPKAGLLVNTDYASVSYEVAKGEKFDPNSAYDDKALDVFGRLNWTFQQKDEWYASFHSMVSTTVDQDVRTLKQYKDGMLISADISTSSLVNLAREFCYIPSQDRVIWREAKGGPSTYDGFDTPWSEGEPKGNMTISGPDGFKAKNGLPATELSVYIFREETVLSADPVTVNADGTYTITYHMNPEVWETEGGTSEGAAAYYCNQMKFTGGLTDVPKFKKIDVSFTFNENYETLRTAIHEEYSATMGFTVGCSADSTTEYSYTTPFAPLTNAYEEYFKKYAQMEATGAPDPTIDPTNALASAFAPVINGPATLSLDLEVNGKPVEGVIYVDLHTNGAVPSFASQEDLEKFLGQLEVRAKIGNVGLEVKGGAAYVAAGDLKLKLTFSELTDLLGGLFGGSAESAEGAEEEGENPLAALMNGAFTYDAEQDPTHARMHSELALGGVVIPIDFNYFVESETLAVSLDKVQTAFSVEGVSLAATLAFTEEAAPASLEGTEQYAELGTYISDLVGLFGSDALRAEIAYEGYGLNVTGTADLAFRGGLKVQAALTVAYGDKTKTVGIAYAGDAVCLDLDGVKLSADVNEAAKLIRSLLPEEAGSGFDLPSLIDTLLFTTTLSDTISVTEEDSALQVLVKAGDLVKAFGFDLGSFDLGTVTLGVSGGELSVSALGARISVHAGDDFSVQTEGYTEIVKYASAVAGLIQSGYLSADIAYNGYGIVADGTLDIDLNTPAARAQFNLTYGRTQKAVSVVYAQNGLYLDVDGLKLSANAEQAIGLVKELIGTQEPAAQTDDTLDKVLGLIFSFRFGDLITVSENEAKDTVTLAVEGTELLTALGVNFGLGDVTLALGQDGTLTVTALDATIALHACDAFTVAAPEGYVEIVGYAEAVADLIGNRYLAAQISYDDHGVTAGGELKLDLETLTATGDFTVTYNGKSKAIGVIYAEDLLCIDLDGLKLSVNAEEAIGLVRQLLAKDTPAAANDDAVQSVLEKLFAFRFGDLIALTENEAKDTATLTVEGTQLLTALGAEFALGNVTLTLSRTGEIAVSALGVNITVGRGEPFTATPADYAELTPYLGAIADIVARGGVSAELNYRKGELGIAGSVRLSFRSALAAEGEFTVTYKQAQKEIGLVYTNGALYLDLDGLQLSADADKAIGLVKQLLAKEEPAAQTDDTLDKVLGILFGFRVGDILTASEEDNSFKLVLDGTDLLTALGADFKLGDVVLTVSREGTITASAYGVTLTAEAYDAFAEVAPAGYPDIVRYAGAIAQLVQKGVLTADVSYGEGNVSVTGELKLDVGAPAAKGTFTVAYGEREKELTVIYAENKLYLDLDGLQLAADVDRAVALVKGILTQDAPAGTAEEGTLDKALGILFGFRVGDLVTLSEAGDVLTLTVEGTDLLAALGAKFELGTVTIGLGADGTVTATAHGANITVRGGEPFTAAVPADAVEVVVYAEAIYNLIRGGYLAADLTYEGHGIRVEGELTLATQTLAAEAVLTVTCGETQNVISVIYTEKCLYLDIDGMKLMANIEDAVGLVKTILAKAKGTDAAGIDPDAVLEKVFSFRFGDLIKVSEESDTLTLTLFGTELLQALGAEFDLGTVTVTASKAGEVRVTGEGLTITLGNGQKFDPDTSGYADLVAYANAVIGLLKNGLVEADVTYSGYGLEVNGTLNADLNALAVQGSFTVAYGEKEKALGVVYADGKLYLDLDGLQLAADAGDAIALVKNILGADGGADKKEAAGVDAVLEKVFSFHFSDLLSTSENEAKDTFTIALEGTALLQALGVEFKLGRVELDLTKEGTVTARALGATVTARAAESVSVAVPENYADIVDYAKAVYDLIKGGHLDASVAYEGYGLTVEGDLYLDFCDTAAIAAQGDFTVSYGEKEKKLSVVYLTDELNGNKLYLDIDGLQVCAGVEEAIKFVEGILGADTAAAAEQTALDEILGKVFALDFGALAKISETKAEEGDTLTLTVQGTDLLAALGIEFKLGQVEIDLTKAGTVTARAFDATITAVSGQHKAVAAPGDYPDIVGYAAAIYTMISGGLVEAEVRYEDHGILVTGTLAVDFRNTAAIAASGTFNVVYGGKTKALTVIYAENALYLDLDGLQVCAGVEEAVKLVETILGADAKTAEEEAEQTALDAILEKVFALDFGALVEISENKAEEGDTLTLTVQGTELLAALGAEFKLGQAKITLTKEGAITAAALGATIEARATDTVEAEVPAGYVDIVSYANAVYGLIQGNYLKADITYQDGGLTVTGELQLDIKALTVSGSVRLQYGQIDRTIGIGYANHAVYLTIDGLKLQANTQEAVKIVEGILTQEPAADGAEDDTLGKVLGMLFSFRFGDLISLSESGEKDVATLTVQGTELLNALLGKETFALGEIALSIGTDGVITATALNGKANVTVQTGGSFSMETSDFADVTPVLQQLPAILSAQTLAIEGDFYLTVGGTKIALENAEGVFSWKEGIRFYLKAHLCVGGTDLPLGLYLTKEEVQANICGYGIRIAFADLPTLENALVSLYGRIYKIISQMVVDPAQNPLPEIASFNDLLNLLKGTAATAAAIDGAAEDAKASQFDWTELVQNIVIGTSKIQNGIASVSYKDVQIDLLNKIGDGGFLGLKLGYTSEKFTADGNLGIAVYSEEFPEIAAPDLTAQDIETFLGYIGSAIELFETTDLTLTLEGQVTSTDTVTYPDGVKYDIQASMSTHRGESNLIHLDLEGKHLWVDADVFAHASINVKATNPADTSIFIDLFILDLDEKGEKDNMLDFYVTLSQFGDVDSTTDTVPEYNPVRLYAPSQEILTILSAALPVLGVDADILNNYLVNYWLTLENVAQLKALGSFVLPLLGDGLAGTIGQVNSILDQLASLPASLGGAAEQAGKAREASPAERKTISVKEYLKELKIGADELKITLNSAALYGMEGLDDVQAILTKDADSKDEAGNYTYGKFHRLDLLNIYDNTGTLNTSLNGTVGYDAVTPGVPKGTYQSFLGADDLILSLVKSATHGVDENGDVISGEAQPHHYAVNRNFYIDGSIAINANLVIVKANINIRLIALSVTVDENGALGINIRLEYDGAREIVTLINGNSTVDITIKNGLVYMKRVQTNHYDWGWKNYTTPITLYRVAPLGSFTADILDHLAFILNFSDTITSALGSATGSGSTSSTAAKVDFGKRLSDVLSAYTFTESADGASWDLTLNGDALVKGVLGNLNVKIKQDKDGYIRTIKADTKVVSIITATVELHWRNAGGTMESGITDQTHDIVEEDRLDDRANGFGGITEKLLAQGWGTEDYAGFASFLEGQKQTVTFKHSGTNGEETLGSQDIIASTGNDGAAQNTLYSALTYPDVSAEKYAPADETQVMGWAEVDPGEALPSDYVIRTKAHGHPIAVTFRSETELGDGWQYREADGKWYYEIDMWYNAKITLGDTELTVTESGMVIDLWTYDVPAFTENAREGHWQKNPDISSEGATFVAEYDPDTITYHSEVAYTVTGVVKNVWEHTVNYGTDYTVYTPTAKGYKFLGWYEHQDDGSWTKVEVGTVYKLGTEHKTRTLEALWVSNLSVTITKAEKSKERVEGGYDIFGSHVGGTTYCDYAMEAVISGGNLIGAFAKEATLELTYSFDAFTDRTVLDDIVREIGTKTTTETYPPEGVIFAQQERVEPADTPRAHVQIKYTYKGEPIHDTGDVIATGEWVDA